MDIFELLGDKLTGKEGELSAESLRGEGRYIGLYFSAHWCPPCKSFTPKLADFYSQFKEKHEGKLEIIFISSDRDEDSFKEYYGEMPWLALPFALRDKKNQISKKYKVQGIPTLVILDSQTGETVCKSGREEVMNDPTGEKFPWTPRPIAEILQTGKLVSANDEEVDVSSLKDKVLGIYCSAHWCPPCRIFTPELSATYMKVKEAGQPFEIIFASSDKDEGSFKEYLGTMPWLAFPFADPRIKELSKIFGVSGIPTLVILDKDRKIITKEGRGCISGDKEGKNFPWYPPPVYELNGNCAGIINEEPSMILFSNTDEDDGVQKAMGVMKPVAEELIACEKTKGKGAALKFFITGEDDVGESLQQFLGIDNENLPLLVCLDIPEQRFWKCEEKEVTVDIIRSAYESFVEDKLEFREIKV